MYVSIAQFTRDYWCASELELRLEGFDRSVTRKTVVQLRRHCTLIWGRWGEGENQIAREPAQAGKNPYLFPFGRGFFDIVFPCGANRPRRAGSPR